ncbi:MAG: hypothetical protein A3H02_00445 [Candidatus Niyogibacteria bacterium RIFCSPLOWO2_12_FULL_41_13]|uniref:UDP-N-acetylmuramyl-tripeptide synthetase n=1 Tax=Candidatus Niyogibacteria bacterium RIFCSPLOWO2_12_FULL_41_13 TaxID=1801726 RepID=A0A1G2F2R7_9BACT|nr:MAG: hypothetical protein A3H02_00445 [Candidatus Niyogibacteria bacterium RIFCSPLOWO2_12_FULL_41_13]
MDQIKKILPGFFFSFYHFVLSWLGAFWHGYPSRNLIVVGITGTKGKTTTAHLLAKILEEAKFKTALISSLEFRIGEERWKNDFKMTMPGRFFIQKFLRRAKEQNCQYAVIETTSQGILQSRHRFIDWDVAIFTNIAPEHIEAHGGFENYIASKKKLFVLLSKTFRKREVPKVIIANLDDKYGGGFLEYKADNKIGYGIMNNELGIKDSKFVKAENIELNKEGIKFELNGENFSSSLLGKFNLYNILAAVSFGISQNIHLEEIKRAIGKFGGVEGRMEFVQKEPFSVVVDYAHTPDSLKEVYQALKEQFLKSNGRLICVLGSAGGGRDKWKRPEMGKIAAEYCDEIILTDEDPYDENPASILNDIEAGFSQIRNPKSEIRNYSKILDRKEAIKKGIKSARQGDVVIITGKGAESFIMSSRGQKIPHNDRETARKILQDLN